MSPKPFIEKRQHPRVADSVPLKISSADFDFVTETRNISCSGVYCKVDKYIEPMTRLDICLLLPVRKNGRRTTKKVCCCGVVVRIENILNEDCFNTAIFFSDIHPRDSRVLADFVESVVAAKKGPVKSEGL